ncbi:alanine racemase [Coprothermobacter platensis]|uniref:alanine racemase n=1 Tax=Coprothermobacter platensis TaxID=108819 RepID=UPI00037FFEA9|nr:alanine racemase [Coprothermobacter platensis]
MWNKWVEISKQNLKHNVSLLTDSLPSLEPIAVVKDDAYGHDMGIVVPELLKLGVKKFAVVCADDALMLSELGAEWILVLDDLPMPDMASEFARRGIRFCITDKRWMEKGLLDLPLKLHLFVDIGMHREGIPWDDGSTIKEICHVVGDKLEGVCSHMSSQLPTSNLFKVQEERFRNVLSLVPDGIMVHLSNSGSLISGSMPYATHYRPGIALYGYGYNGVKPVLSLKARIVHEHTLIDNEGVSYDWLWKSQGLSHIVTVPVGYGDGYSRRLSNKAKAGVKNYTLPQVGAVTMDFTMFEAPGDVAVGDEVTLLGAWGSDHFWADDMANLLDTIPYEVLTGISHKIPRVLV